MKREGVEAVPLSEEFIARANAVIAERLAEVEAGDVMTFEEFTAALRAMDMLESEN